jgi:hypothetical protein
MDAPTSFVDGAMSDRDCAKALAKSLKNTSVHHILESLRKRHTLQVKTQHCAEPTLRGYFEVPPGDTIVLCCNHLQHEQVLLKTLQHELVHAVDYLERGYNFHDPEQLACSEVSCSQTLCFCTLSDVPCKRTVVVASAFFNPYRCVRFVLPPRSTVLGTARCSSACASAAPLLHPCGSTYPRTLPPALSSGVWLAPTTPKAYRFPPTPVSLVTGRESPSLAGIFAAASWRRARIGPGPYSLRCWLSWTRGANRNGPQTRKGFSSSRRGGRGSGWCGASLTRSAAKGRLGSANAAASTRILCSQ